MRTYDLSRRVDSGMPTYPGDPEVELSATATVEADGYRATELSMGTHAGTHVDAPAHTEPGGRTLEDYPASAFRFDAVRLDLAGKAPRDPIERVDVQEAAAEVDPHAAFAADLMVLRTGWDEYWGTDWYRDHPFLTPDAAEWFVDNDYHVAVDAPNVDPTPSPNARPDEPDGFPAHHAILGDGRLVVENLTNLAAPPGQFTLHAYPLALADAEAAPARAVAVADEQ